MKFCRGFFQKKIQGGALYIAIIVSIVIGVILSLFILLAKYNQRHVTVYAQQSQLNYNLLSAFEIARSDYFSNELNNRWFKNSTNDDSVRIKKLAWGAYLVVNADTKNRHHKLSKAILFGTSLSQDSALVIADNGRPIGAAGQIIFKANCYLPKPGLKAAYIEGQTFIYSPGNAGFIRPAPNQVQQPDESFIKAIKQQANNVDVYNDSVVQLQNPEINQSFNNKTLVYELSQKKLSGLRFKNNVKLICREIEIDSSCHFENALLICEKVRFKEGFKGSIHVIARDSISMDKKCEFSYPSSFVVAGESDNNSNLKCIQFNEECRFYGGVVAVNTSGSKDQGKVFVKLHAKSEVSGMIYSSDYIHLEGKVYGTVIGNSLLLKTPSAVYENHILACELDPKKYGHILAVPLLFNKRSKLIKCSTLP